ncbi:cation diffusion zinc membrane transporter Zrg17 [Purpureocillium takamizusanense]|uniref:Zinc transporter n=1 Tax=Purpureocillium takamizusanense TaxID=2060973 RepID=A0A9Q8VAY8_9HYPO|nr:cation diffusion zinc membrane transporter Zrg17 [Purpureocillium takamizusanense]UNI19173.1 cation diffusion zinc membrane transporter Zrg17 [Purpureocillium takamizusanense]
MDSPKHHASQPPPTFVIDGTDDFSSSTGDPSLPASGPGFLSPSVAMPGEADTLDSSQGPPAPNPFNFQTQVISTSPVKSNIGQRRGHRYKHSSISAQHQIFQEPPPRPPPVLPASLPIPTIAEAWKSTQRDQRTRLYWSLCHLAVAVFVFFKSEGSLAAMALSHLVFFDAGSAAVCAAVEVLGNFEVWRRSSIRHPFGLERAEVLAGFALSIFLLFGGFDLVSHNLKHFLESLGSHEAHHEHAHEHVSAGSVDLVAGVAIVSTLISAYGLKNHARIAKVMRVSYLAAMPSVLSNPFHFLTLFFSALIALLPLFSISLYTWLDRLICAIIALAMFGLGMRVAIAQGLMLLMSYGGSNGSSGVSAVLREIESETAISRVEDAQFWQVHYGLCMANLRLSIAKGYDETSLTKLRSRISALIQNRLGEGYGTGGFIRWEVTLQMRTDAAT